MRKINGLDLQCKRNNAEHLSMDFNRRKSEHHFVLDVEPGATIAEISEAYEEKLAILENQSKLDEETVLQSKALVEHAYEALLELAERGASSTSTPSSNASGRHKILGGVMGKNDKAKKDATSNSGRFKATVTVPLNAISEVLEQDGMQEEPSETLNTETPSTHPEKKSQENVSAPKESKSTITLSPELLEQVLEMDSAGIDPNTEVEIEVMQPMDEQPVAATKNPAPQAAKGHTGTVTLTPDTLQKVLEKSQSLETLLDDTTNTADAVEQAPPSNATETLKGKVKATVTVPFSTISQIVKEGGDLSFLEEEVSKQSTRKTSDSNVSQESGAAAPSYTSLHELQAKLKHVDDFSRSLISDEEEQRPMTGMRRSAMVDTNTPASTSKSSVVDYLLFFLAFILPLATLLVALAKYLAE